WPEAVTPRRSRRLARRGVRRDADEEGGPRTRGWCRRRVHRGTHRHRPAMICANLVHDRKPEPGALQLAREVGLENPLLIGTCDPRTVVLDGELPAPHRGAGPGANSRGPSLTRVQDQVV